MDCSLPGSSVHGVSQAIILEWVAMSSSRGSSWSGIEPLSLRWQVDSLPLCHLGSPLTTGLPGDFQIHFCLVKTVPKPDTAKLWKGTIWGKYFFWYLYLKWSRHENARGKSKYGVFHTSPPCIPCWSLPLWELLWLSPRTTMTRSSGATPARRIPSLTRCPWMLATTSAGAPSSMTSGWCPRLTATSTASRWGWENTTLMSWRVVSSSLMRPRSSATPSTAAGLWTMTSCWSNSPRLQSSMPGCPPWLCPVPVLPQAPSASSKK